MNTLKLNNQTISTLVTTFQTTKCSDCFGELYNRYYSNLFAYCRKITRHPDDAYDIAMESFMKAAEKIETLKKVELFPSWLFRIARNLCLDRIKKLRKSRLVGVSDSLVFLDDTEEQEIQLEKEAKLIQMENLMDTLEPEAKEILVEKYINKKTLLELQAQFGISESAAKMRLLRAKRKISRMAS